MGRGREGQMRLRGEKGRTIVRRFFGDKDDDDDHDDDDYDYDYNDDSDRWHSYTISSRGVLLR